MNLTVLSLCGVLGLATTLLLIPFLRRYTNGAATGTFHHTHKTPISRLGGVALASAFVLVALVIFVVYPVPEARTRERLVILFSALAIFFIGLWDDLRPLGARKKLLAQILISLGVCVLGIRIEVLRNPFSGGELQLGIWGYGVTILWLVGLTNLINLVDGIDGLAGGISMMMMGLLAYVGMGGELYFPILVAAGMFGALLGFLFYNFPPAKIYMGDGGAYLLGFLIAILTLVHSQKGTIVAALIAPMFALALPITDVCLAIIRRGLKGLPIFRPDRKHLHHRLQELGFSRTRTVLMLYGVSSFFLLMAFGVVWSRGQWIPILFGFGTLVLLLSARSFNFSRDWFAVGRVLENSAELRRETHYALALSRWLELEAERGVALEELWADYEFIVKKLGFARMQLRIADGVRTWQSSVPLEEGRALRCAHELNFDGPMTLEFEGDQNEMSRRLFEHLSELAAECWLKAAHRWQSATSLPVRFGPLEIKTHAAGVTPAVVSPAPRSA